MKSAKCGREGGRVAHAEQTHVPLPVPAPFTGRQEIDLDVVRELISHFHYNDFEEAQELILSALQEVNERFGWVSPEASQIVADHLGTTINRVYGLLTFYADFRTEPRGYHHLLVCHGMSCYVLGSQRLVQDLADNYGIVDGGTSSDNELSVQVVNGCLGVCDRSPVIKIDDEYFGPVTAGQLNDLLQRAIVGRLDHQAEEEFDGSRRSG
jgi:NADH-quinone oxidoreductase subunit E